MQPDSMETRVGRLEQAVAGMRQQLEDQSNDIKSLTPLAVAYGRFELIVERLQEDQRNSARSVEAIMRRLDEEREQRRKGQEERRKETQGRKLALTVAVIAATATMMASLVTAVAVLVH
jgi:hypothetical protein